MRLGASSDLKRAGIHVNWEWGLVGVACGAFVDVCFGPGSG